MGYTQEQILGYTAEMWAILEKSEGPSAETKAFWRGYILGIRTELVPEIRDQEK